MRLAACAPAGFLALAQAPAADRMVTDSAGRQVAVPDRIARVFAAGPPAMVLLYVLAPDKMIGWPRAPHPDEMPYLAPEYRDLPEVGWLTGRGDTVNLEVLLQSKPDLVFDFGSVRNTYFSLAERVQAQTGIPYLLIDGTFANTPAAVRLLGEVLGVEEYAEQIASYAEGLVAPPFRPHDLLIAPYLAIRDSDLCMNSPTCGSMAPSAAAVCYLQARGRARCVRRSSGCTMNTPTSGSIAGSSWIGWPRWPAARPRPRRSCRC
jgi:hypothetical protein